MLNTKNTNRAIVCPSPPASRRRLAPGLGLAAVITLAGGLAPSADALYDPNDFNTLADIEAHIQDLVATNPTTMSTFSIGTSYEGRDIKVLAVGNGPQAILITSAMWARDWMTVPVAFHLAENWNHTSYTLYVVPVANPDGYEYTWTDNRTWRKDRQPVDLDQNGLDDLWEINPVPGFTVSPLETDPCSLFGDNNPNIGIDVSRNWDVADTGALGGGWGTSPGCSYPGNTANNDFAGPLAFASLASRALSDFMTWSPVPIVAHINYQESWCGPAPFDGAVLYPRGQDPSVLTGLGGGASAMFRGYATAMAGTHEVSQLYCYEDTSGSVIDWAWDALGVLSFNVVLSDATGGGINPPNEIPVVIADNAGTAYDLCAALANPPAPIADAGCPCAALACPPSVGSSTNTYKLVGGGNGIDWSWCIISDDCSFADASGTVAGVSGTSADVAVAFANGINAYSASNGCGTIVASATSVGVNGRLEINMGGATNFILEVGPAGTPCGDPVMCRVGPTDGPCSFNPTIEQIVPTGVDCNDNGFDDAEDIAFETSTDLNGNGIPDECEEDACPADLDGNQAVDTADLLTMLAAWGPNPGHPADFDGDGNVSTTDLLTLLAGWGACMP